MDDIIRELDPARRLARSIVSDIAAYHKQEVERGVVEDTLFTLLGPAIEEGRSLFESRTDREFHGSGLFEKALVDLLLKPFGRIKSRIW